MTSKRDRSAQNKGRRGQDSNDFISIMPDEVLLSILCLLPFRDAVVTSSLSTRWQYLWRYLIDLNFVDQEALDKIANDRRMRIPERAKYIKSVNSVVNHYHGRFIQNFRIRFDLDNTSRNVIDKCIRCALTKNVKMLELDFLQTGDRLRHPSQNYSFQKYLLDKRAGSTLKWRAVNIIPMEMSYLKKLVMKSVNLDNEALEILLENCPVLETFSLHGSGQLTTVRVGGQPLALKHLDFMSCFDIETIYIHDFNLVSFSYKGPVIDLSLVNLPKLEHLYIGEGQSVFNKNMFCQISSIIANVQFLTFDVTHPSQSFRVLELPELPKVNKLTLKVGAWNDDSLLDFALFANVCPVLETFAFELVWFSPMKRRRKMTPVANHPRHNLKTLEISGYYGRITDLELAMYFIENAISLKKILIDPSCKAPGRARIRKDLSKKVVAARSAAWQQLEPITPNGVKLVIL